MLQGFIRCFTLGVFIILSSCIPVNEVQPENVFKIYTGPGPEDLVHDGFDGRNRLLISCTDRTEDGSYGEIEWYALGTADTASQILPRFDFPAEIAFHPHGVDIIEREGEVYLYVVNHYKDEEDQSSIIIFRVEEDHLLFIKEFKHTEIWSPNAVTAHPNGGFYITNDGTGTDEALIEFLFNTYNGTVSYCSYDGDCVKVAGHLSYPNGILKVGEELLVATSVQKAFWQYDIESADQLSERTKLSGGLGLDNIREFGDYYIVAQHTDLAAFLAHYTDPDIQSPCKVLAIHKLTGETTDLFYSGGDIMSGASTGLIVEDDLFIGQVVKSYILKVADVEW